MSAAIPDALNEWRNTAPFWVRHASTIRTMFSPLTEALIKEAGIREGQSVLDVAGGAGEPSLTIAERVRPSGSVTCTDVVAEMVAAAEAEAQRRHLGNVTFRQCHADSLPFGTDSFDRVVSRLGVMFFPVPLASLREMLRVLKPSGVTALVVWGQLDLNPFTKLITEVISRRVPSPPADPDAPGAFRFAEEGKLAHTLAMAGAADVRERVFDFRIKAPISFDQYWALRNDTSDTLRAKLSKMSETEVEVIRKEVSVAAGDYFPRDQMDFPARMLIVSGSKPG